MKQSHIRNFSIIAHIDHGKSTLADRILDVTGSVTAREKVDQMLDNMDIERERGITVKSRSVRLSYTSKSGEKYVLNLIDTPGHVDFHYEVSRSLAACEGALLVVDATQGVEAQTVAHVYTAIAGNLEIVPVLNKVDLPTADPETVRQEIEEIIGLPADDALLVSGKSGLGVPELIESLIERIPPPAGNPEAPLKALLFDSWFDPYQGVIVQIRVIDGSVRRGSKIKFMQTGAVHEVDSLGVYSPFPQTIDELAAGEVGFLAASIKTISDAKVGDTITDAHHPTSEALPGFEEVKPFVFSGLYPTSPEDYQSLREALDKLKLNDAAIAYEPETSAALGFGFRVGYLGLLHMEIVQERLEREFELDLVTTTPTVVYKILLKSGETVNVDNPARFPPVQDIDTVYEPMVLGTIHALKDFLGGILALCEEKRGVQKSLDFHVGNRVRVEYYLPLNEIVIDFYDRLKSVTKGYGSFDYEFHEYRPADLVKIDLKINGEPVDALSAIVYRQNAQYYGRKLTEKMKDLIDRHMFEIAIQASIGSKVIARSTVKALRKNVTAKCYGGDITRKRKLLEKQKEGKKRMKQVGSVKIPQEAFLAALKLEK
ncbi:MAG TPA: translation elongation factor 4 [Oligoflexia bacterium]|nr:translation elongation factor 4 [Oligoflexia bacterium]HMP47104.1 translation elongation factor 4 [Oligoflexia bacterium]